MAEYSPPVVKARREQMYFPLDEHQIARLGRFGERHRFAAGDYLIRAGETGLGMVVLLSGRGGGAASTVTGGMATPWSSMAAASCWRGPW